MQGMYVCVWGGWGGWAADANMEKMDTHERSWAQGDGQFQRWGQGWSSQRLFLAGGPCMNWVDKGHPPGALEVCEHCVDCVSWASPLALLALPSHRESVPCGREVMGHLSQRPWGMTHISRETPAAWSHVATMGPPQPPQSHPELHWGWQPSHSGPPRPSRIPGPASAGTSSGLVNRWEGGPGSGQSHWAELATPPPGCPAALYHHHPGSRVSTG